MLINKHIISVHEDWENGLLSDAEALMIMLAWLAPDMPEQLKDVINQISIKETGIDADFLTPDPTNGDSYFGQDRF